MLIQREKIIKLSSRNEKFLLRKQKAGKKKLCKFRGAWVKVQTRQQQKQRGYNFQNEDFHKHNTIHVLCLTTYDSDILS
jgi:hypothetical protein